MFSSLSSPAGFTSSPLQPPSCSTTSLSCVGVSVSSSDGRREDGPPVVPPGGVTLLLKEQVQFSHLNICALDESSRQGSLLSKLLKLSLRPLHSFSVISLGASPEVWGVEGGRRQRQDCHTVWCPHPEDPDYIVSCQEQGVEPVSL